MGKGKHYTPNEMRSRSMNPQDSMGQAAIANHHVQITSGTPKHDSSGIATDSEKLE